MIERKIRGGINEAFVNRVHMNVLRAYVAQIERIDMGGYFPYSVSCVGAMGK